MGRFSVRSFVRPFVRPSVRPSVGPSVRLPVALSVTLSSKTKEISIQIWFFNKSKLKEDEKMWSRHHAIIASSTRTHRCPYGPCYQYSSLIMFLRISGRLSIRTCIMKSILYPRNGKPFNRKKPLRLNHNQFENVSTAKEIYALVAVYYLNLG